MAPSMPICDAELHPFDARDVEVRTDVGSRDALELVVGAWPLTAEAPWSRDLPRTLKGSHQSALRGRALERGDQPQHSQFGELAVPLVVLDLDGAIQSIRKAPDHPLGAAAIVRVYVTAPLDRLEHGGNHTGQWQPRVVRCGG